MPTKIKPAKHKTLKPLKPLKPHELPNSRVRLNFKKHFVPPLAGLLVMGTMLLILYSGLIVSKISYWRSAASVSSSTAQDVPVNMPIIDPAAPPRLKIEKLHIDVPINFELPNNDEAGFQKALRDSVVHYVGTATPGNVGNVAIFGHSSNQLWAPGHYKFVFTLLEKLQPNDKIFLEYKGLRYIYNVTDKLVVNPTDVSVLQQGNTHKLSLITCTPIGTSKRRLVISAAQIVPKIANNYSVPQVQSKQPKVNVLPGNSPSFWDNVRSLFN